MKKTLIYFALLTCVIFCGYCNNDDNSEDVHTSLRFGAAAFYVDFSKLTTSGYNISKLEVSMDHDWTFCAIIAELTIDLETATATGTVNALYGNWTTHFNSYANNDTLVHMVTGPTIRVMREELTIVTFTINPEEDTFQPVMSR